MRNAKDAPTIFAIIGAEKPNESNSMPPMYGDGKEIIPLRACSLPIASALDSFGTLSARKAETVGTQVDIKRPYGNWRIAKYRKLSEKSHPIKVIIPMTSEAKRNGFLPYLSISFPIGI